MKRAGIKPTRAGSIYSVVVCSVGIAVSVIALALLRAPLFVWGIVLGQLLFALAACIYYLGNDDAPALSAVEYEDEDDEPMSPADRLRQLQELWDENLISDAEFRTKRAEILNDL